MKTSPRREREKRLNINHHWTDELAAKNHAEGKGRYTVIPRSGSHQGEIHECIDDLNDFYTALKKMRDIDYEKVRVALAPKEDRFYIMYYPEDGKFWVIGFVIDGSYWKDDENT